MMRDDGEGKLTTDVTLHFLGQLCEGQYIACMEKQTRPVQTPDINPLFSIMERNSPKLLTCPWKYPVVLPPSYTYTSPLFSLMEAGSLKIVNFRPFVDFFPSFAILCFVFCDIAEANYIQKQQEQIVLKRSLRLILDPGRVDQGDGVDRWSFTRGRPLRTIICKRPAPSDDHL